MPDIALMGAVYPDVPSIILPTDGGGTAQFYDMSGDWSWLGKDAEIIQTDFYSEVDTLDNTDFNGWSPSSTAKIIVPSVALTSAKFTATDLANYEYYMVWECGVDPVYTGDPAEKALTVMARAMLIQEIGRRYASWAAIESDTITGNASMNFPVYSFLRYYGTTAGSITYTWAASYGFYFGYTAPTLSSTTLASPTITPKTPTLSTRCSTTYFSTANAGLVDQANSHWWIKGSKIIRVKREGVLAAFYHRIGEYIVEDPPYPTT